MEVARVEAAVGLTGIEPTKSGLASVGATVGEFGRTIGGLGGAPFSALGKITDGLGKIGLAGMGLRDVGSAIKGTADALGFGLVNEMEQTSAVFNAFTKDGDVTAKMLAQVRDEANKTPFAFAELAKATAALMPAAKSANVDLLQLQKTAEVLGASNALEGLEGASFSLREAMSGDFTSIIERFNLSRTTINKLKDEGVSNMEIVGRAMAEMGFDSDLISAKAQTLDGRWSTFMDTLDTVKMTLAQPMFDIAKEGLMGLQTTLDDNTEAIQAFAKDAAAGFGQALRAGFTFATTIGPAIISGIGNVVQAVQPFVQVIQGIFENLFNLDNTDALQIGLEKVFGADSPVVGQAMDMVLAITDAIKQGVQMASDAWGTLQQVFAGDWSASDSIDPIVNALGLFASFIRDTAIPAVMDFAAAAGPALQQALSWLGSTGFPGVIGAAQTLGTAIQTVTSFLEEHKAAQAALVGILTGAATAWALYSAAALATSVATRAVAIGTQLWTAAQAALNVVMAANPLGIAIVALAAIAAALIYAYNTSEEFRSVVDGAMAGAVAAFQTVADFVGSLPGQFEAFVSASGEVFNGLSAALTDALNGVSEAIAGALNAAGAALQAGGAAIEAGVAAIGATITAGFQAAVATAIAAWEALQAGTLAVWNAIPADIRADLELIGATLIERFTVFVATAQQWMTDMLWQITNGWTEITTAITLAWTNITQAVTVAIVNVTTPILAWLANALEVITTGWTAITTAITEAWTNITDTVTVAVANILTLVLGFVADTLKSFTDWATDVGTQAMAAMTALTTPITKAFTDTVVAIQKWVGDMIAQITGFGTKAGTEAQTVGTSIIDGIITNITSGGGRLGTAIWDAVRGALDFVKRSLGIQSGGAGGMQDAFTGGITGVVPGGQGTTTSGGTHGGHPAIDIFAAKGTPIISPVGGMSAPAYYSLGGNATIITGDDGKFYYFAHGNVPFLPGRISKGQVIGQVGQTGNAMGTDPHLHAAVASSAELFNMFNGSGDFDPAEIFNQAAAAAGGLGTIVTGVQAQATLALNEIEAYIRQSATLRGINADTAVAVAKSEGGLLDPVRQSDVVTNGRREMSFGPFQLNIEGGLGAQAIRAGIDPRNPADWKRAVDFALEQAVEQGWGPFHGAARAGIGPREGLSGARSAPVGQPVPQTQPAMDITGLTAAKAATDALATSQAAAQAQAELFAGQESQLEATLRGQVSPSTILTSQAMTAFSQVLGPIERQVAGGAISMDTLQFKLTDLARATGLAAAPWRDYDAGLVDINEAMARVIIQSSDAGPQFDALRQRMGTTNTVTDEMALQFLQLAANITKVPEAATTAVGALDPMAEATVDGSRTVGSLTDDFGTLKPAIDDAQEALKGYIDMLDGLSTDKIGEQVSAFESLGEVLNRVKDTVDGQTWTVHIEAEVDDILEPGSPTPMELGVRGITSAVRELNRHRVHIDGPVERSGRPVGLVDGQPFGGTTGRVPSYNDNSQVIVQVPGFLGTKEDIVDAVQAALQQRNRTGGNLGF